MDTDKHGFEKHQAPSANIQRITKIQTSTLRSTVTEDGSIARVIVWRLDAWSFSGACPSSLRFDEVAPKPEAKAERLELGCFISRLVKNSWTRWLGGTFAFHPRPEIRLS